MKLNTNNYYGKNANKEYMSVSQYKEFNKCEACAMAQIKGIYEKPKTSALFLGSFVDELLTGTRKSQIKFILAPITILALVVVGACMDTRVWKSGERTVIVAMDGDDKADGKNKPVAYLKVI
jgi:hypothetical protein